ncbi:MAG TPA: prolyl oligopeptidase family serine peptidase [Thermoanaerobaculia bacterium]|jgi:dipeptidyl aminopeptidase/acylaminoacyl peptidase|nr:prolyl oligopeptidase family serine peptidase [Thermoanaerobaculia bacterium]
MRSRSLVSFFSALLLALPLAAQPAADLVGVPDTIIARHVPDIPRSSNEGLLPFENLRVAWFADWHPSERRLLIRTRFGDSTQIHEVAMPMGARTQLTFYKDTIAEGYYRPGHPDQILVSINEGGAENFQFLLIDRATGKAKRITDGKSRNTDAEWSHDGKLLAYVSNARNGRDFDLYVTDASAPGAERLVAQLNGSWELADWSPDDKRLLLREVISANEAYLHWADVATGEVHALTPRRAQGQEPIAYQDAVWSQDGRSVLAASDLDSEVLHVVRIRLEGDADGGKPAPLAGLPDLKWDVESFDLSDDGNVLAYVVNEDGFSRLRFFDLRNGKALPAPEMPAGVMTRPRFRPGTHEVGFALNWARATRDVYSYDADARRLERWTASEAGGLNTSTFALPELVHFQSFDGRTIPAFLYRPPADRFPGPRPVYIDIHGGPEEQARPNFLGSNNYIINELGVAFIAPNVRGSAGYGKSYMKLDNAEKREDSVKDIGALLDWIAKQPGLDASRVMVGGGSYGGYMVLASLVHYSDRLRCAFDSVGISDFVTFLESTSEYRRDLRRAEYGDERDPKMRETLLKIAPARNVERIGKPLLVSQGANDPRVPLSESDQIVAALEKRGVPVWYLVGKDEGHGFQKKGNSDYQRVVLMTFIRQYLLGG